MTNLLLGTKVKLTEKGMRRFRATLTPLQYQNTVFVITGRTGNEYTIDTLNGDDPMAWFTEEEIQRIK